MTTQSNQNGVDFLPEGYEAPKGSANYMKLEKGENRFRILSKSIIGWIDWQDNKPLRFRFNKKPDKPVDPKKPIKHFWAFVVWNYKAEAIQVIEVTQNTIQTAIQNLCKDDDWGNPFMYDIKITKTGESLSTEYSVNPVPHKQLAKEAQEALLLKPCNLDALFDGGDPFEQSSNPVSEKDDMPF